MVCSAVLHSWLKKANLWSSIKGWVEAEDIKAGDYIAGKNYVYVCESNKFEDKVTTVYNLEVKGTHTFFILAKGEKSTSPIWVHNSNTCPDGERIINFMIDSGVPAADANLYVTSIKSLEDEITGITDNIADFDEGFASPIFKLSKEEAPKAAERTMITKTKATNSSGTLGRSLGKPTSKLSALKNKIKSYWEKTQQHHVIPGEVIVSNPTPTSKELFETGFTAKLSTGEEIFVPPIQELTELDFKFLTPSWFQNL